MIKEISVCAENKKGSAKKILSVLSELGINILSFISSDSGEFGTMRLVVTDTEKAFEALQNAGYLCKVDSVIVVALDDEPGALVKLLEVIEEMNINVGYMYVGYMREDNMPVITIHCEAMPVVEQGLVRNGYRVY